MDRDTLLILSKAIKTSCVVNSLLTNLFVLKKLEVEFQISVVWGNKTYYTHYMCMRGTVNMFIGVINIATVMSFVIYIQWCLNIAFTLPILDIYMVHILPKQ